MPQSYKKSTAAWASWRRKGRRKDQHLGSSKLLECTALPPCLAQKQSDLPHWRRGPMCLCHTVHQQPSRCRRSSLRKGRKGGKGQQPYGWIGKAKETMPGKKRLWMLPCCRIQQHELFIQLQHQSRLKALILTLGLLLLLQTGHFPMESCWLLFKFLWILKLIFYEENRHLIWSFKLQDVLLVFFF